jgi:hypothetical protein
MKPRILQLLVFVLLVGIWGLGEAVEPLKPYDDFQLGPINPDKWVGAQFGIGGGFALNVLEANRTIILDPLVPLGRDLRILNRAYGENNIDTGGSIGAFRLAFKNPSTISAIRARIQVQSYKSTGCPGNTTPTAANAQIFGFFFNAGTPGNGIDDVIAGVGVGRASDSKDPPGVLRVDSFVARCSDADCVNSTFLVGVSLGTVTTGQWVKLLMQWDQANHQFIFQRGTETPVLAPYDFLVTDTQLPGIQHKSVGVNHSVANCTAVPRPVAKVDALFDNVFVNQSALP